MRDMSALKDRCISLAAWLVGLMFLSAPLASGLLAGPGWAAAGETAKGAGTVDVQFEEGLLTFKADNAQLIDVLRGIAEKARFRTVLRGDLSKPITMSVAGIALVTGIWRLIGDATVIMVHDSPRGEGQVPQHVGDVHRVAVHQTQCARRGWQARGGNPGGVAHLLQCVMRCLIHRMPCSNPSASKSPMPFHGTSALARYRR